uniref:Putative movement protein n=1 Tax=Opuntia virus 1 TaxID=2706523 RepID=A0A6C0M8J0_9GEMI|nr:putative movement protein [Opuntia virus 1]QHU79565.1 putative movement protein [Opuntia virus 1]
MESSDLGQLTRLVYKYSFRGLLKELTTEALSSPYLWEDFWHAVRYTEAEICRSFVSFRRHQEECQKEVGVFYTKKTEWPGEVDPTVKETAPVAEGAQAAGDS